MDHINKDIVEGGLDNLDTEYVKINKHIGGKVMEYRRRIGGKTSYMIRDYIINYRFIIDDPIVNDQPFKKNRKSEKNKENVGLSDVLVKISSKLTPKDIALYQEIGKLFEIDITGDDPKENINYVLKNLAKLYRQSSKDFVKHAVERFRLKQIINDSLRDLHESIVIQYWNITCQYINKFPQKACYDEPKKKYPGNYSDDLIRFKSIKFTDQNINKQLDKIQGFCPFEPKVRIQQLLDFPIEILTDELASLSNNQLIEPVSIEDDMIEDGKIFIEQTESVEPPSTLSNVELIKWYSKKIINRWKLLQPAITEYEQLYNKISNRIINVSNFLQVNCPCMINY